ncbi:hypothetical protein BH09SUM1_BH09SUM1_00540 [soil metagenome]
MPTGKPFWDSRPGTIASMTARLCIAAILCALQYYLLATAMEALHSGEKRIVVAAFIASFFCFLLTGGLILTGELSYLKVRKEVRDRSRK